MTLTPNIFAFATISTLFLDETACEILLVVSILYLLAHKQSKTERSMATYSAANVLLCMRRRSMSLRLWTTKALWPEGIRWRVFLFEPYPI